MFFSLVYRNSINYIGEISICLKRPLFNLINLKYNDLYKKNLLSAVSFEFSQVQCLLSTSAQANNVHTTKGWKFIARTGQKKDEKEDIYVPPTSCEEGSDAVPHAALMNQLQNCKSIPEQIETFCSMISITTEDIEKRKLFCNSLIEAFRPYFTDFRIHLFGSTINGLGFKGCDLDVSIQTIFNGQEYLKDITVVPTLDSVIQGTTTADTVAGLPPRILLRFVRRIIRMHCTDVREPILFIKGRCPILRFYNAKYDVYCDFSYENEASLRNTKLLRFICQLDERFAPLARLIRYWGKYGGFVGDIDMFNSYSFSLLVVHFLQQTHPPVLPPIKEMIEKSSYLNDGEVNDDDLLIEDLKKFEASKNSQPVEELLRDFFFYFLNFDYSRMMVPLTSSIIPKVSFTASGTDTADSFVFSPVTVQDPFRVNFNVTATAMYKNCRKFLNGIVKGCKVYQDETVWHPSADTWGICSLFHRPLSDSEIMKEWQKNCIHTIHLPFKLKASVVKDILQECLLFDCSEMNIFKGGMGILPKFNCKVYHNTWQGRDYILKNHPPSLTHPLEIENWVSKQILQEKEERKNQVLFTFLCECYENESDNELKIVLSFKEPKLSPIVAIFLKDYIPTMCKRLVMEKLIY